MRVVQKLKINGDNINKKQNKGCCVNNGKNRKMRKGKGKKIEKMYCGQCTVSERIDELQ